MLRQGRVSRSAARAGRQSAAVCPLRAQRALASSTRPPASSEAFLTTLPPASLSSPCQHAPSRPLLSPVRSALGSAVRVGVVEKTEELLLPMPWATESPADDPSLANPLLRMERLSTGWFGVIMEYDGVVVETSDETHRQAWLEVADEFGYKRPLGQLLRRIKGVRDEVVVSRVFAWTHNPSIARQIAQRKGQLYEKLMGGRQPAPMLEARPFLDMLKRYSIPVALVTPLREAKVLESLQRHNLQAYFDAIVTADDSGSAEVEYYYAFAASKIQRPPLRCVVIGESNTSVEAAHELGMKCLVVTGNAPVYDYAGADLVIRNLSQLSLMSCKRLFAEEQLSIAPSREAGAGRGEDSRGRDAFDDGIDDYADDDNEGFQSMGGAGFGRW